MRLEIVSLILIGHIIGITYQFGKRDMDAWIRATSRLRGDS
jgi:hypothetical protein